MRETGQGVIVKPIYIYIKKHNPRMTTIKNIYLKDNIIYIFLNS